jgi:tetratricopeptide (TPR) repeat protein
MKSFFNERTGFIIIALIFFFLGIARLNDHSLYTDCTRYLIWGNSLAEGKGFVDDTRPEPEYYIVNAPLYAVILVPALIVFPLSLLAAKVWTLCLGILALFLFYRWLASLLGNIPALASTLILSLNPLTLVLSTEVLSETSFLCMLFGILALLERIEKSERLCWTKCFLIILLSLMMLLREVGAALVLASIIFFLTRRQWRIALFTVIGTIFFFLFWTYYNLGTGALPEDNQSTNILFIFQHFVTSSDTSIIRELTQRFIINIKAYSSQLSGMLFFYFPSALIITPSALFIGISAFLNAIKTFIAFILFPWIIIGIVIDLKSSQTALFRLLFLFLYLSIILLYPVQDIRFLFPLLPFLIFYLASAWKRILNNKFVSLPNKRILTAILLACISIPNLVCIFEIVQTNLAYSKDPVNFGAQQSFSIFRSDYFSIPWNSLGTRIKLEVPKGSIIVTPNKEIAAFAPGYKFLELNRAVPLPFFETHIRDYAAEYLLAPIIANNYTDYQTNIDESKRFRFTFLFRMNRIAVYRIESQFEMQAQDTDETQNTLGIMDTANSMRMGRGALQQERYSEAGYIFSQFHSIYPYRADIIYQLLIAHTFLEDTAHAYQDIQDLYSSPKSTSYITPAQIHISAMEYYLRSQSTNDSILRAEYFSHTAQIYWQLGYPLQAYHMMQRAVESDSNNFMSLLWAIHYGIQTNHTQYSQMYLNRLDRLDHNNPLVKSFENIFSLTEKLHATTERHKRSILHSALSKEYDSIELSEEAVDEAQRAIGENPSDRKTWDHLADLYKKKNKPLAMNQTLQKAKQYNKTQTRD